MNPNPKVSVITVVYNGADTIRDCIDSVQSQTFTNIEHIVVDGGSTDGTQTIVESYGEHIHEFISEPDNGIYDAMNKGIHHASGDVIAILNADDMYVDDEVLESVVDAFKQNPNVGLVYGDLQYVARKNTSKIRRVWRAGKYTPGAFRRGWTIPHPSCFVLHEMYERFGMYRTDLPIAADYELILRMVVRYHVPVLYIPSNLVTMRTGGTSGKSFGTIFRANREVLRAWQLNGFAKPYHIFFLKPLSKLLQFFHTR